MNVIFCRRCISRPGDDSNKKQEEQWAGYKALHQREEMDDVMMADGGGEDLGILGFRYLDLEFGI